MVHHDGKKHCNVDGLSQMGKALELNKPEVTDKQSGSDEGKHSESRQ